MAPTASLVGICDASSKMTRSKGGWFRSMNCATEMGLINMQGHSCGSSVGSCSMMRRMVTPRPPDDTHRFSCASSVLPATSSARWGMRFTSAEKSISLVSCWNSDASWRYCSTASSNSSPLNIDSLLSESMMSRAIRR